MSVQVGEFNKRTLLMLVAGLATIVILRLVFGGGQQAPAVVEAADSVPMAEKRLQRLRQIAATVPGKETVLKDATADLALREAGILRVDTAAEAQAELLQILSRVAKNNGIDARGANEMRDARPLGNDYAEVSVAVSFTCQIEQLVNTLAQLSQEPAVVATNEIRVLGRNDKKKVIDVRLSISGVAPRAVMPKKGAARTL